MDCSYWRAMVRKHTRSARASGEHARCKRVVCELRKWCRNLFLCCSCPLISCLAPFLLLVARCSDKTIKYWKVHEKKIKRPSKVVEPAMNLPASTPTYLSTDVSIPKLTHHQTITTATPKRVYSNAHGYHINCFPEDDHQLLTQEGFMTLRQVEAHFAAHGTLSVACPLEDGSMIFSAIEPSALLVHDGTHAHVEMVSSAKSSSSSSSSLLSLAPTTNHRMWVSVAGKPFAMHTAGELSALAATASPALATPLLAQFEANCPLGSTGSPAPLPFLYSLSLTTVDQSLAFLQLYGLSLQFAVRCDSALILVLQSSDQCSYLDSLLARLPLPLLSTSLAALAYKGQHGYCRYGLRSYAILSPAWISALHADATSPEMASWVQPCSALELRCILHGLSGGQPLQSGSIVAASLVFRDQLTLACLRAGYTSTFTENAADETWSVHYSLDTELTRPSLDCASELRVVHKTGRVWCVTVPTAEHRIIFRRVLRFGKDGCNVAEASRPVVVGNSISINSDGETFISADDLRINLWNLQISNETFNVVDVKPPNLEELTEVITSATFHPHHCSQLIYSSSRGSIRLADLRDSALCDQHAKLFEVEEDPSQKSFFSEIISSISDAQFIGHEGRYILSRDYLTLKVWDVQMENRPVAVIPIHEYLKVHLCDLYENDWSDEYRRACSMLRAFAVCARSVTVLCDFSPSALSLAPCVASAQHLRQVRVGLLIRWQSLRDRQLQQSFRDPPRAFRIQHHSRSSEGSSETQTETRPETAHGRRRWQTHTEETRRRWSQRDHTGHAQCQLDGLWQERSVNLELRGHEARFGHSFSPPRSIVSLTLSPVLCLLC